MILHAQSHGRDTLNRKKFRIAVATNEKKELEDNVSEVFGRANTFTIVQIEDGEIQGVKLIENPAATYIHGAGPIVVKELVDLKIDLIIAPQFGPGASTILEQHGVTMIKAEAGTKVREAIQDALTHVHNR